MLEPLEPASAVPELALPASAAAALSLFELLVPASVADAFSLFELLVPASVTGLSLAVVPASLVVVIMPASVLQALKGQVNVKIKNKTLFKVCPLMGNVRKNCA